MIIESDYPSTTLHTEANQPTSSVAARSYNGLPHRNTDEKGDTASPDRLLGDRLSRDELPHSFPTGEDELTEVIGEALPTIAEGFYEARIEAYEPRKTRHGLKLYITLTIIFPESIAGQRVTRYYNVRSPKSPRGHGGGFALGARSDAYREFKELLGGEFRVDRLPVRRIVGMHVLAEVVTVRSDHRGNELHPCNWYSKAKRLMQLPVADNSGDPSINPCLSPSPYPAPSPNPSASPSLKPRLKPRLHPILDDHQWAGISE
jgi:hypothetical protein